MPSKPKVVSINLDAKIRRSLEGREGYNLAQKMLKGSKTKTAVNLQTDVRNALKQGQRAVNSPNSVGITGITSSGAVRVNDREGKVIVNVPSWRPLSKAYARSKPRSKVFWKKSGGTPLGKRSRSLRQAYSEAIKNKATVTAVQSPLKKGVGGHYTSSVNFTIKGIKSPLDNIIGLSFVKGRPSRPRKPSKKVDRSTVAVISFPERDRPLLGYIAASLGDRSKQRIARKFHENLQVRRI